MSSASITSNVLLDSIASSKSLTAVLSDVISYILVLQLGSWGNCSSSCGGGVQNRTVACVDQRGKPANASLCLGKIPADQLQCNVLPCNFCSQTMCAGQVCMARLPLCSELF